MSQTRMEGWFANSGVRLVWDRKVTRDRLLQKEYHPHCYTRDNCVIYFKESGAEELR